MLSVRALAILILGITLFLGQSESCNNDMTELTVNETESNLPTADEIINEVMEFESERSATLLPTEARLHDIDVVTLCDAMFKDGTGIADSMGKKMIEFISVTPEDGYSPPSFRDPCFGWIRKPCVGTARPPFDYRCHFWVPYISPNPGSDCTHDNLSRRKKRMSPKWGRETVIVSGLEAMTLCETRSRLPASESVQLVQLALPTNEASTLRCINWKFSEFVWTSVALSKKACEAMNLGRPEGSVVDTAIETGDYEDGYSDVISCRSRETLVDCIFVQPNVQDEP